MNRHELIQVINLSKSFVLKKGLFHKISTLAVDDVSFSLMAGETLALIGESGSGKTTVAKMILGLLAPDSGEIRYRGDPLESFAGRKIREYRKVVQAVLQDPHLSMNPAMKIGEIVAEPLRNFGCTGGLREKACDLLETVGIGRDMAARYPHQLSGGQKQRVAIARAIAAEPEVIILDEPLSALDITVQNQIISLLTSLKTKFGVSYLLITHDLRVMRAIADRVVVMRQGKVLEIADKQEFIQQPQHPYSASLLSAIPTIEGAGGP